MKFDSDKKAENCAAQNKGCGSSACANCKGGVGIVKSPLGKLVSAMGARATFGGLKIFCK